MKYSIRSFLYTDVTQQAEFQSDKLAVAGSTPAVSTIESQLFKKVTIESSAKPTAKNRRELSWV